MERAPRATEVFALWLLHLTVHAHGAVVNALLLLRGAFTSLLVILLPRQLTARWSQGAEQTRGWKAPPPSKIAVVVAEQQAVDTAKIASVLGWFVDAGVKESSLYFPPGLKDMHVEDIALRLSEIIAATGKASACAVCMQVSTAAAGAGGAGGVGGGACRWHGSVHIHTGAAARCPGGGGGAEMTTHVLSSADSTAWMLRAATGDGAAGGEPTGGTGGEGGAPGAVWAGVDTPAALDEQIRRQGGTSFEPELILVFGPSQTLAGYPPWQTRLAEIYHLGALEGVGEAKWQGVLRRYSRTMQRCGT